MDGNLRLLNDCGDPPDHVIRLLLCSKSRALRIYRVAEYPQPAGAGVLIERHHMGEQDCVGHAVGDMVFSAQGIA